MHGLTEDSARELLASGGAVWVRPLSGSQKSPKPMRLLTLSGAYAVVAMTMAGRTREARIRIEKLERAKAPTPTLPSPMPTPPVPSVEALAATAIEPAPPPAEPPAVIEPTPPPQEPHRPMVRHHPPGKYVVRADESGRYYTPAHTWREFDAAKLYDTEGGANKAAGHLRTGRSKGAALSVLRVAEAIALDARVAEAAAPPPAPVPAVDSAATGPAPAATPTLRAATVAGAALDYGVVQRALEAAMRGEAEAEAGLLRARAERVRAQVDLDILFLRIEQQRRLMAAEAQTKPTP